MKHREIKGMEIQAPRVIAGCMRHGTMRRKEMEAYIHGAMQLGVNFFDHADIYEKGESEIVFGKALKKSESLKREDMIIQSKCGIRPGQYDLSKDYILESVDGILERLQIEYLDILLLHRPDALVEPEEVAAAFDELEKSGKVRSFGVSNHKPSQIELLKKYVHQDLVIDQLQFSIPVSNMVANGMEVNMETAGSADRDGSVLDYCRLNDVTIQAWSPFQMGDWKGPFLGAKEYRKLNKEIERLAKHYEVTPTTIAAAWVLRHPAKMQLIAGTTQLERLEEIVKATEIELTRKEWYDLYLAAGHILP